MISFELFLSTIPPISDSKINSNNNTIRKLAGFPEVPDEYQFSSAAAKKAALGWLRWCLLLLFNIMDPDMVARWTVIEKYNGNLLDCNIHTNSEV